MLIYFQQSMKAYLRIISFIVLPALCFILLSNKNIQNSGWVNLIKKGSLSGWVERGGIGIYKVVDDAIIGKTPANKSPTSFLCTEKEYSDFELKFETKIDEGFNSGVQIRSKQMTEAVAKAVNESMKKAMANMPIPQIKDDSAKAGIPKGFAPGPVFNAGTVFGPQIEIAPDGVDSTSNSGYIFGEGMLPKFWLTPDVRLKPHNIFKNNEWNKFRVVAQGSRIQTWINGEKVEDLTDEETFKTHPKGFIALQLHFVESGKGPYEVAFKNIKIRTL